MAHLLASTEKGGARVSLQATCDGPLGGFFADARADGACRGYARNSAIDMPRSGDLREVFGTTGRLAVIREADGKFFTSTVAMEAMVLATDMRGYFAASDQIATAVSIAVVPLGDEPLGCVAAALVQELPKADAGAFAQLARDLDQRLFQAVNGQSLDATALAHTLFPQVSAVDAGLAHFTCECSLERVRAALATLAPAELLEMAQKDGGAVVACRFCSRRHHLSRAELEELARQT